MPARKSATPRSHAQQLNHEGDTNEVKWAYTVTRDNGITYLVNKKDENKINDHKVETNNAYAKSMDINDNSSNETTIPKEFKSPNKLNNQNENDQEIKSASWELREIKKNWERLRKIEKDWERLKMESKPII